MPASVTIDNMSEHSQNVFPDGKGLGTELPYLQFKLFTPQPEITEIFIK